ncbi:sensor histidine kinase [Brevundimonas sp.]|uniref:sensor histidine kinase n=1 Tax=Brevundimonas sp. TaxID=1871086 RepID=UPI002D2ACCE9|nr:CHASE3 domain-containing protein [Brevundimonas sp.]HYC96768.1 CHASE3 domain-containing protein [Brevundimonas sp.]
MSSALRLSLSALVRFARTPSIGRSVVALLAGAILLLLAVNVATFVMIQRTAAFNDQVERSQQVRRAARDLLLSLVDAETGQRGFLLSGRPEFLAPYSRAEISVPEQMQELERLTEGDPELEPHVQTMLEAARDKLAELERTVALSRTGRIGEAVQMARAGEGRALMDAIRTRVAAIDEVENLRVEARTRQSERGSGLTLGANAFAGLLIIGLAGIMLWLVRRYVGEIQAARESLDRMNAGLEGQVRDRTAQLTRANDEIQRFAYIVSHDLRAPLVNIMGYTAELEQAGQVLDRQVALVEQRAPKSLDPEAVTAVREDMPEAIGFIRASTAKMDRLINAILKLSREGRRSLVPELLDVTAMARGAADSVRHQTGSAGAQVIIKPLPRIESDRLSMEQILGNLIDNAVKYLDPARPGRIVVSGEDEPGGWVVYRIADNGRGISARDHERIFELFRRSGKQDRPGEGLGLAFVRNSVRRLGGEISVESELGKGSTFVLKFPTRLIQDDAGEAA